MGASGRSGRQAKSRKPHDAAVSQRKERVLHTRVPESLDRHIKSRARGLGLSVSTVVRNVLLNTFGLVEDIVTDSTNLALAFTGDNPSMPGTAKRARGDVAEESGPAGGVVAWQEAVLNVNAVCEQCNAVLRKGERAAIGLRERPGPPGILCPGCLDGLGAPRRERKRQRRRTPA